MYSLNLNSQGLVVDLGFLSVIHRMDHLARMYLDNLLHCAHLEIYSIQRNSLFVKACPKNLPPAHNRVCV